jgi:serine/threonine protein kinase
VLQPGQEFAGFQIGRLLGSGGMGQVYEARHLRLGRVDVVKVLRPDVIDAETRARFLREAQHAARLQHPHVVAIYSAGEAQGQLYLHLQRIGGPSLRQILDLEGPLPVVRALALLGGIADALDAAHAIGLVHRDVKPANILVTPAGPNCAERAYLTDFGISTVLGQTALTQSGFVVGTVGYLPPELLCGGRPEPRSDVYSLGRVLEETLTGVPPGEPSSPYDQTLPGFVPRLPATLRQVIDRACATDPRDRFPTCGEFLRTAWQYLAPESTLPTVPAPSPYPPGSPLSAAASMRGPHEQRRRRRRQLLGLGVVAVLALAGLLLWQSATRPSAYLDQLSPTHVDGAVSPKLGLVSVGGKQYAHGLSFPSVSGQAAVSFAVPSWARTLTVRPGFDDDQPNGSAKGDAAEFGVAVDNRLLAQEAATGGAPPPEPISVPVGGHSSVTLTITVTKGVGTVSWADPRFG